MASGRSRVTAPVRRSGGMLLLVLAGSLAVQCDPRESWVSPCSRAALRRRPLCWQGRYSRCSAGQRTAREAGQDVPLGRLAALLTPAWQAEASRCWSVGEDGLALGLLADLTPEGLEYDPLTRIYVKTAKKPQPQDQRPWQRLPGEPCAPPERPGDQRAEDFSAVMQFFGKAPEESQKGGVMLDIGCGEGYMARRMAHSGQFDSVIALDVDWRQLEAARRAAEEEGLSPERDFLLMRADAQELPFAEGVVDFAWWGMGMHKVQNALSALKAVASVLRPGGRLVATTIASSLPGRRPEDLESKAREAGFSEVEVDQPRETEIVLQGVK